MENSDRTKIYNIIVNNLEYSPPYGTSEQGFQRWTPISGNFDISKTQCGNNPTGRAFTANPCGYWNKTNNQFNPANIIYQQKNINSVLGLVYPSNSNESPSSNFNQCPPQDRIVFGYTRIGNEYRTR